MKLSRKLARELGIVVPPKPRGKDRGLPVKAPHINTGADEVFDTLCKAHGLPVPVHEYQFHPIRKWRIDYLFEGWLALEVEGGVHSQGRHIRAQGFLDDIEKYNALSMGGYVLVRCTPEDIRTGAAFELIRAALGSAGGQP